MGLLNDKKNEQNNSPYKILVSSGSTVASDWFLKKTFA